MFKDKKADALERRLASLEEALGIMWYDALEEHELYLSSPSHQGALQRLHERTKESHNATKLHRLLDYLGLTEVTYPEKVVIEKIKGKK